MSDLEHIPTAAPDPALIQALFDEDPLNLTDTDLDQMIAYFRQDRINYLQPTEPKAKKASAKKAISAEDAAAADDLLLDLGL